MNYEVIVKGLRAVSALREVAEEETDHRETLEAWAADAIEQLMARVSELEEEIKDWNRGPRWPRIDSE